MEGNDKRRRGLDCMHKDRCGHGKLIDYKCDPATCPLAKEGLEVMYYLQDGSYTPHTSGGSDEDRN